jgi:hypothetical protein
MIMQVCDLRRRAAGRLLQGVLNNPHGLVKTSNISICGNTPGCGIAPIGACREQPMAGTAGLCRGRAVITTAEIEADIGLLISIIDARRGNETDALTCSLLG